MYADDMYVENRGAMLINRILIMYGGNVHVENRGGVDLPHTDNVC